MTHRIAPRVRLVHLGVGLCLLAAGLTGYQLVQADAPAGVVSALVPIAPCRLADTRPDNLVGTRATPVGAREVAEFAVWGANGDCTIPATASGIATNVTTVNPNANSFLTVFPGDAARPLTSNLNWTPTSPPTPNQVTVGLSATGTIKVFNNAGTIDVIIDIVGYYVPANGGPAGSKGPTGQPGNAGASNSTQGPVGDTGPGSISHIVTVALTGQGGDFPSIAAALNSITDAALTNRYVISVAPGTYFEQGGIDLRNGVDIVGSGQDETVISCTICAATGHDPAIDGTGATVRAAGNVTSELRDLSISSTGSSGSFATAVWAKSNAGTLTLHRVSISASGATHNTGLYLTASVVDVNDVSVSVSTGVFDEGVHEENAPLTTLRHVTITSIGGVSLTTGISTLNGAGAMSDVNATVTGGSSVTATGISNTSSSPSMNHVNVIVSGGTTNVGVKNINSSPQMTTVSAAASGGTTAIGVQNTTNAEPVMNGVDAIATDATNNFGMQMVQSSPQLLNVTATGQAGTGENAGIDVERDDGNMIVMRNVTTTGIGAGVNTSRGRGLVLNEASATMTNVTARGVSPAGSRDENWGIDYFNGQNSTLHRSTLVASMVTGSPKPILDNYAGAPTSLLVFDTTLTGPPGGTMTCINVVDPSLATISC